ncbi:MAG: SLC13 family permease [Dethiosulfatibacter sp.]|nr:SLC13 family permease [Dethiosulfatibacter sp.]
MTMEIGLTYGILAIAIVLFVTEKLRTDLVAVLIMLLLPWAGIITVNEAFSGFASNAVISVMAVMIIGYGIEKSGVMKSISKGIINVAGHNEKKILVFITSTVGLVSAFMQNIGAAALFLPAIRRISKRTGINVSKLIMPMGFAAILGGTLTMVASGPLIVLNDLIGQADLERFNLFSVTPIGAALLFSGILCFYLFGNVLLPNPKQEDKQTHQSFLRETFSLPNNVYEITVSKESTLIEKSIEEIDFWNKYNLHILALNELGSTVYAPWRKTRFQTGQVLAILGLEESVKSFAQDFNLHVKSDVDVFLEIKNEEYAGFAELIVPPKSDYKGKSLCDIAFRKNLNIEPIIFINREGEKLDFFQEPLEPGQEMIVFGRWEDIKKIKGSRDLVVVTDITSKEFDSNVDKSKQAVFSLVFSLVLILIGVRLSLSFFTGAFLMVLLGVIPKDEFYQAIDWKTVFLLAGLIPLGIAFDKSGAARLTANQILLVIDQWRTIPILFIIGLLATLFSLFMSNVAATVLLVPLVIIMGDNLSIDPRGLALLVAICASNSFILPTHQVNAFLMNAGGYKNADYFKAGGIMSILFLVVAVFMIYFIYI